MMRGTISLTLISLVVFGPVYSLAQDPASHPDLERLLRNLPKEVARFSQLHPLAILSPSRPGSTGQDAGKAERIWVKAQGIPVGTEVIVGLKDGDTVEGELTDVSRTELSLRLAVSEEVRGNYPGTVTTQKRFNFEEVINLFAGLEPRAIPPGKTVEVRLVSGDRVKGELNAVAADELTVNDRAFAFDEILSIKPVMRNRTKAIIILGITVPLAIFLGYAYAAALGA